MPLSTLGEKQNYPDATAEMTTEGFEFRIVSLPKIKYLFSIFLFLSLSSIFRDT